MRIRRQGALTFFQVEDEFGSVQLFVEEQALDPGSRDAVTLADSAISSG